MVKVLSHVMEYTYSYKCIYFLVFVHFIMHFKITNHIRAKSTQKIRTNHDYECSSFSKSEPTFGNIALNFSQFLFTTRVFTHDFNL